MQELRLELAKNTLEILQKPTFNRKDIAVIMNKVTAGRSTFEAILVYIEENYPEYYKRKDKHNTLPRKYCMEYLERFEGIDINETLKWAKKVKDLGILNATN